YTLPLHDALPIYSTALFGRSSRNSFANWAARVLFGAITRVGRWTCSISHAAVADLPVPVAPSSTTSFSPAFRRSVSSAIAVGWSPAGWYSETTSSGAVLRCKSVTGRMAPTVRRRTDIPPARHRVPGGPRGPRRKDGCHDEPIASTHAAPPRCRCGGVEHPAR